MRANNDRFVISKQLALINSFSSLIARVLNITVLLWVYQYLLKRIPAEEFAIYPVIAAIMVFAPLFFAMFSSGVSRYVVSAWAQGDREQVTRVVSSIFPMLLGAASLLAASGIIFLIKLDSILQIPDEMVYQAQLMMGLLLIDFILFMLMQPFTLGFPVRQRFVELNIILIGQDLLRSLLLCSLLLGIGPKIIFVVVATVSANFVRLLVEVVRSRQLLPGQTFKSSYFEWEEAKRLMSFGVWTTLGQLGNIIQTGAATVVLNLHGTAVDVTSYHLGSTFYRQLSAMISVATSPLQPVLTAMHVLANSQQLENTVLRTGRYALWVSMAAAAPLIIFSGPFMGLYLGDQYPSAGQVLALLMATFPFVQATTLLSKLAVATARVRGFCLPAFGFQCISLVAIIVFVVHDDRGATGAALALALTVAISQVIYFWPLQLRIIGASFGTFARRTLIPGLLPAIAASGAWLGMRCLLLTDTWVLLVLQVGVGHLIYSAVLFTFCLCVEDKADLHTASRRLWKYIKA